MKLSKNNIHIETSSAFDINIVENISKWQDQQKHLCDMQWFQKRPIH
jgi:hypothetical protein